LSQLPWKAFGDDQAWWLLPSLWALEERPPIIKLNNMHPNVLDAWCWLGSGLGLPLVKSALNVMRLRPLESACCFVSTLEEVHLEKSVRSGKNQVSNRERKTSNDAPKKIAWQ